MTITTTAAIEMLRNNAGSYSTKEALLALAQQVSLDAAEGYVQGSLTVLYSGQVTSAIHSSDVISAMVANGDDVRIIDKTQISQFLQSNEFLSALGETEGLTLEQMLNRDFRHPIKDWLFDANIGPWADASRRFSTDTVGDVRVVAPTADFSRVFGATELKALLDTGAISSLEGIPISELKDIEAKYGASGLEEVFKRIKIASAASVVMGNLSAVTAPDGSLVVDIGDFLNPEVLDQKFYLSHQPDAYTRWNAYLNSLSEVDKASHMALARNMLSADEGIEIVAGKRVLNKLGVLGVTLGFTLAANSAAAAESAGDHEGAKQIMEEWAADAAGSAAGEAIGVVVGGIVVGALAVAGVGLSVPLAGALVFGAALVGGFFGADAAVDLIRLFHDRDNNQHLDITDRLSNLLFGATSTITTSLPVDLNGDRLTLNASFSREEMVANATGSIAWRYALRELNPFVVTDMDYSRHNTDGSLDLYDPVTGQGAMTDEYMADRAAMLTWLIRFERKGARDDNDAPRTGPKPYNEDWDTQGVEGNWDFVDLSQRLPGGEPLQLAIDGAGISLHDHQVVFGSQAADTIEGAGATDRLYGGGGNDRLHGAGGSDYLEGGNGFDIYFVDSGEAGDRIRDTDGSGEIRFTSSLGVTRVLDGGKRVSGANNLWRSDDDQFTYRLLNADNGRGTLTIVRGTDIITIDDFAPGDLGITLEGADAIAPIETTRVIRGDIEPAELDEYGNPTSGSPAPGRDDVLHDTPDDDRIEGLGGDDILDIFRGGRDVVLGGDGDDRLWNDILSDDGGDILQGEAGRDRILGGGGDDSIWADHEENLDALVARGESEPGSGLQGEWLDGHGGNDTVVGGSGNDAVWGGIGDDVLVGASGDDNLGGDVATGWVRRDWTVSRALINGTTAAYSWTFEESGTARGDVEGGADVLTGGAGNDWLYGGAEDDYLDGGADDDVLFGGAGVDALFAGSGADILVGDEIGVAADLHGGDFLDGGDGDDVLWGFGGADHLYGGEGHDVLLGDSIGADDQYVGDDLLDGGAGNDDLNGGKGADSIYGGAGNDLVRGSDGNDYADGGAGNDLIISGSGSDTIIAGAGNDTIQGMGSSDSLTLLIGGEGSDSINGGYGRNLIYSGDGGTEDAPTVVHAGTLDSGAATTIYGGAGVNQLSGGGAEVVIHGGSGTRIAEAGAAAQATIYGGAGNATVYGGSGTNVLYAASGGTTENPACVVAGSGTATLYGGAGPSYLVDTIGGSNVLIAGAGNDTLVGAGHDTLVGGAGRNVFLARDDTTIQLDAGFGQSYVRELSTGSTIRFGGVTQASDLALSAVLETDGTADLVLSTGGSAVTIRGGLMEPIGGIRLADGPTLNLHDLATQTARVSDVIQGGAGHFYFTTHDADSLVGGFGQDTIAAWGDNDTLVAGPGGGDLLYAGGDDALLRGGTGNDTLVAAGGDDTLISGGGNDILVAGSGDVLLQGGSGHTTYVLDRGFGGVVIAETSGSQTLLFNGGLTPADLVVSATMSGEGPVLNLSHGSGSIAIHGGLTGATPQLEFAEGPTLTLAEFVAGQHAGPVTIAGAAGNLIFDAGEGHSIQGGSGADTISAWGNNDTIRAGSGNTLIYAMGSGALVIGGAGNDTLVGMRGDATLVAGMGEDTLIQHDGLDRTTSSFWSDGIKLRDSWVHIDGSHGANVYNADGSSTGEEHQPDGEYSSYADDGQGARRIEYYAANGTLTGVTTINTAPNGDVTTTRYDSEGVKLSEGVTSGEASTTTVYLSDGGYLVRIIEADGDTSLTHYDAANVRLSESWTHGDGSSGNNVYNADGSRTSTVNDGHGNSTSTDYDPNGVRLSESWSRADGSHGTDTFNGDGSSTGQVFQASGQYEIYTDDGDGNRFTTRYSAQGTRLSDYWTHADGSFGADAFNGDGSSVGNVHNADGSYSLYQDNGHGDIVTSFYNAEGEKTGETSVMGDGHHRVLTDDGEGNVTSTTYDANERRLSQTWRKSDGSHGNDTYAADGSRSGTAYAADGTYSSYTDDGKGLTVRHNWSVGGVLLGHSSTRTNGLSDSVTTHYDASGSIRDQTWIHGNGDSGHSVFRPEDNVGSQNLLDQFAAAATGWNFTWETPDGASGDLQSDLEYWPTFWADFFWISDSTSEDAEWAQSVLNAQIVPGESTVNQRLNFWSPTFWGGIEVYWHEEYENNDVWFWDGHSNVWVEADFAYWGYELQYWSSGGGDYGYQWQAVTPIQITIQGINGFYSVFTDDGFGYMVLETFSADGVKVSEEWLHNDGSKGIESFNEDGSSEGVSYYGNGTVAIYSEDGQGGHVARNYPGALAEWTRLPPPPLPPPPAPPHENMFGAIEPVATGHQGSSSSYTESDGDGGYYEYTFVDVDFQGGRATDQGSLVIRHFGPNNELLSSDFVFTDPGFAADVPGDTGTIGWNYDAAGIATGSHMHDGTGHLEHRFYDSNGLSTGTAVEEQDSQGTITTRHYSNAGQLTGSSVRTVEAPGRVRTTRYDASGTCLGFNVVVIDVDGNSAVTEFDANGVRTSFSVTLVSAPGQATTTAYDAGGQALSVVVSDISTSGEIVTDFYGADGSYTGTTRLSMVGGRFCTAFYDALGQLTHYVMRTSDSEGDVVITTYDERGMKLRENSLDSSGVHVSRTYQVDGSLETTARDVDGSYSVTADDGHGNVTSTEFSAVDVRLNASWSRADGTTGTEIFNGDGSSSGVSQYADGTSGHYTRDVLGELHTEHYAADGITLTDSTITSTVDGVLTTTHYDADGSLTRRTWMDSNGALGTDVFNADGSYSSTVNDGLGGSISTDYTALGNRLSESVTLPDGTVTTQTFTVLEATAPDQLLTATGSGPATLVGGYSGDTLVGGSGPNTFVVGDASVVVQAGPNDGVDVIRSSVDYSLPDHVRNLVLTGSGDLTGTGNGEAHIITANSGNDTLIAGTGAATLIGGSGSDTFVVNKENDVVQDAYGTGDNQVRSSASFVLPANVDTLLLTGNADLLGTGNSADNYIQGNAGHSTLVGGAGNDTLVAGTGGATLIGGAGDDVFVIHSSGDVISGPREGDDLVLSAVSYVLSESVNQLTLTGSADLFAIGNGGSSVIRANDGNDTLIAGRGDTSLIGGAGSDTFVVNKTSDVVEDHFASGNNVIRSSASFSLVDNVNTLQLVGSGNLVGTGNAADHTIVANSGNDTLIAGSGNATLIGGAGSDTFIVNKQTDVVRDEYATGNNVIQSSVSYTLVENIGTLQLIGNDDLVGTGSSADHLIIANSGNDTLVAGSGNATLVGGSGSDTFIVNKEADVVRDDYATGSNTIEASVSYVLPTHVNTLVLTGGGALIGTGNDADNLMIGNAGSHTLLGGSGNNTLVAGSGLATLIGGDGNDTFVINNAGDVVQDDYATGDNLVEASVSYVLPVNVNTLILTGTGNLVGSATAGDNRILANSGDDTLISGSGIDTLVGGSGSDTFVVNHSADVVQDSHATGSNVVESSVSYVLPENVNTLRLTGNANATGTGNEADNLIVGNAGNNTLIAGSGNNTLVAGMGLATMIGGSGSDTFVVNKVNDVVQDSYTTGSNTILSSVNYVLPTNVNTLILTGNGNLTGTGNSANHLVMGNAGNHTLTAGTGNATLVAGSGLATLVGGVGSDTFVVNNVNDVVKDSNTSGSNTILSSVDFTLVANVNTLILTGTGNLVGKGHGTAHTIYANDGNDTLIAGSGKATLIGGAGHDTFVVNKNGDVVVSGAGEGIDTILSSANFVLPDNVQNLSLINTKSGLKATGNSQNHVLRASFGDATIRGGNDSLAGGAGVAILYGGNGAVNTITAIQNNAALIGGGGSGWLTSGNYQCFLAAGRKTDPSRVMSMKMGATANVIAVNGGDGIMNIEWTTGATNTITLGGGIDINNLQFAKVNADLILTTEYGDVIAFRNWYGGAVSRTFTTMQVMEFASSQYDADGGDPLHSRKVYQFDFKALVAAFDQARAADPLLLSWSLTDAMPGALVSSSDTSAIGGDLAYAYAAGNISDIEPATVFDLLDTLEFAVNAQAITAWQPESPTPSFESAIYRPADYGMNHATGMTPITAEHMPQLWGLMNARLDTLLAGHPAGGELDGSGLSGRFADLQAGAAMVFSATQSDALPYKRTLSTST